MILGETKVYQLARIRLMLEVKFGDDPLTCSSVDSILHKNSGSKFSRALSSEFERIDKRLFPLKSTTNKRFSGDLWGNRSYIIRLNSLDELLVPLKSSANIRLSGDA